MNFFSQIDGFGGGNPMNGGYGDSSMAPGYDGGSSRGVTRRMLLDTIVSFMGASEVVYSDEFESLYTRHICPGSNQIQLLRHNTFYVNTPSGNIPVEIIFCPNCRKLIVDRNSLELV